MSALGVHEAIAGAAAAALLALSFTVMLGMIRRFTELAFFGPGADPRYVLARLAQRTSRSSHSQGFAAEEMLNVAVALREVWHLRSVAIRSGFDGSVLAESGVHGRVSMKYGLMAGERAVGAVFCTADEPAALENVVEPLLEQIGGMLGAIVQLAVANQDLASLRDRTGQVNREERRLLHRELHDELAPALTGIAKG